MHPTYRNILAILMTISIAGCATQTEQPVYPPWGVDLDARDQSVRAGDDFHQFANGRWLQENDIPAERTSWGVGLIVHERAESRVRKIIEELGAASGATGSPEQKVGDYYASWMDTERLNALGVTALQPDLDRINAISNIDELTAEFGRQYYVFGASPLSAGLGFNPINPDRYNVNIGLTGMGLPDRDYYLEDSERFGNIRTAYLDYIANMLAYAGIRDVKTKAEKILALETKIATHQWVRSERRDRDKTYNPIAVAELKQLYPDYNWSVFFEAHNMPFLTEVNLLHPDTLDPLIGLVNETPLDVWRDYLTFHIVSSHAGVMSEDIDAASFEFWGKTIRGQETQLERWKRGVARVGAKTGLGEALGQIYVKRHFNESAKLQMTVLVENLRSAYAERISGLGWMSPQTKIEAQKKLAAFRAKIGYPETWLDLSAITIDKNDLLGNARRIRKFFEDRDVQKLGKPTDREEWFMMPQTVNAYYLPPFNEIVFPAAILEAPYFDPNADAAVNYGAIGAIIGHEMGHGFDDQGSKYDASGVKRNWWTDADREAFEKLTKRLGEQFNSYEAVPGHFVDGKFTMGENIGDLGGLEVAYRAYQLSLNGEPAAIKNGLTGDQRFFLSYAQAWRTKRRDDFTLQLLKSDPHSPPRFRVNGIVRNVDAWYDAFDVSEDASLYLPPAERVRIW